MGNWKYLEKFNLRPLSKASLALNQ